MKHVSFHDFSQQGKEIDSLRKQIEEDRFVHALMITGEPGVGKRTLAALFAKALLCLDDNNRPCGICESCRLSESGEHPDLIIIQRGIPISTDAKKGRMTIPVSDIREIIRLCYQFPYKSRNRVLIIYDAEYMTVQAQNCLLKILEEPPLHTFFILTTSKPSDILITVRSRCRPLRLIPWKKEYIHDLLVKSGVSLEKSDKIASSCSGSIGRALWLADEDDYWKEKKEIFDFFFHSTQRSEALRMSSSWKDRKEDAESLFDILETAVHELLDHRISHQETPYLRDYSDDWIRFSQIADLDSFSFLFDSIKDARIRYSYNVNYQVILEQLYLSFIGECKKWEK